MLFSLCMLSLMSCLVRVPSAKCQVTANPHTHQLCRRTVRNMPRYRLLEGVASRGVAHAREVHGTWLGKKIRGERGGSLKVSFGKLPLTKSPQHSNSKKAHWILVSLDQEEYFSIAEQLRKTLPEGERHRSSWKRCGHDVFAFTLMP